MKNEIRRLSLQRRFTHPVGWFPINIIYPIALIICLFLPTAQANAKQFLDNLSTDFYAGREDNISINQNLNGSLQLEPYAQLGSWTTTNSPSNTSVHLAGSAIYNGKIYLTGGFGTAESSFSGPEVSNALNRIWYGTILSDGAVEEWKEVDDNSRLPQPTYGHASVVVNNRLYIIGGKSTANATLNAVYWGKIIGHDGSIKAYYKPNTWTAVAALPQALFRAAAVHYEGRVYVIGGQNAADMAQNSVYYAMVQPDGNIAAWNRASALLPNNLSGHCALVSNGRIYVLGGSVTGEPKDATQVVHVATIDTMTGDITTWIQTESLPETLYGASAVMSGGKIWVSGGITSGTAKSTVYYARLDRTTGLVPPPSQRDSWTRATDLPVPVYNHNLVSFNGHLFVIGGFNNTGIQNRVYTSALASNKNSTKTWVPTTPLFLSPYGGGVYDTWTGHTALLRVPLPGDRLGSSGKPTIFVIGGGPNTFNAYADGRGDPTNPAPGAYSTIYNSEIDSNGSLKTWAAPDSGGVIPIASILHSSTIANGAIYLIGGANSTNAHIWAGAASNSYTVVGSNVKPEVWYEEVSLGSSSGGTGGFKETAFIPLLDPIMTASAAVVAASGYNTGTPIFQPLIRARAVSHNGNIYVVGGISRQNINWVAGIPMGSEPVYENRVWYCRPNPGGTINGGDVTGNTMSVASGTVGGWALTTPLPEVRYDAAVSVAHNRVYVFGGRNALGIPQSTVYFAPILADASLGAWQILNGAPLPVPVAEHDVVYLAGRFYVVGGVTNTGMLLDDVYYCTPNAFTGLIPPIPQPGSWVRSNTTLEYPVAGHSVLAYNGYIYALGGRYNATDPHTSSAYMTNIIDMYHTQDIVYAWQGNFERYIDLDMDQQIELINWEADPNSEIVQVQARFALEKAPWSDWTPVQNMGPIAVNQFARYIHYKVHMETLTNDANSLSRTPVLNRIFVQYATSKRLDEDSFQINHNRFDPQSEQLLVTYKTRIQDVSNVILRVYNLEGELIRRQDIPIPGNALRPATGSWTWDGTNENGELVANGVYVIQYNSGDTHKIRKVLVLKR